MLLFPLRAYRRSLLSVLGVSALVAPAYLTPNCANAQDGRVRIRSVTPTPSTGPVLLRTAMADRPMIGILMAAGSAADTAGVRIEEVEADSPAAKAGLKAGDLITDINGTSLRVSKEDAEDLALGGLAQRRLQRVLGKLKAGDDVSLTVKSGSSAARKVSVKTISQQEFDRADEKRIVERNQIRVREPMISGMMSRSGDRMLVEGRQNEHGMVGISVGGAGNARDTLGLFISSVVNGGPAEKAGIVEGERVAAVNGVDVRLAKEDVDDPQAMSARVNRFVREVQKVEPGKTLSLRVYSGGRYRDVTVTAAKSSDMPSSGFSMSVGDGGIQVMRLPQGVRALSAPSMSPRPPQPPRVFEFQRDGDTGRVRLDGQEMRVDMQRLRESLQDMRREIERGVQRGVDGSLRSFDIRTIPSRSRRADAIL